MNKKILTQFLAASLLTTVCYPQQKITGITATASSYATGYPPSNVLDGKTNTSWYLNWDNTSGWIGLLFTNNAYYTVCRIDINSQGGTCDGIDDVIVELKKDGVTKETITKKLGTSIEFIPTISEPVNEVKVSGSCWDGFGLSEITVYSGKTITFLYDDCGNRTNRGIGLKSAQDGEESKPVELHDNVGGIDVTIFPNPTKGEIKLVFINPNPEDVLQYEITDLSGRLVVYNPHANHINNIDLGDQPNGLYIFRLSNGNAVSEWKIIKN